MGVEISRVSGDIFKSKARALVDPSNCVGVKGAGLSLAFKKRYGSALMRPYVKACREGTLYIGRVLPIEVEDKIIICLPTKRHWRDKSRLEWIETGMSELIRCMRGMNIRSVAVPALGCGYGDLEWDDVFEIIERRLQTMRSWEYMVRAEIYEPR